jgi:hypothetical protein
MWKCRRHFFGEDCSSLTRRASGRPRNGTRRGRWPSSRKPMRDLLDGRRQSDVRGRVAIPRCRPTARAEVLWRRERDRPIGRRRARACVGLSVFGDDGAPTICDRDLWPAGTGGELATFLDHEHRPVFLIGVLDRADGILRELSVKFEYSATSGRRRHQIFLMLHRALSTRSPIHPCGIRLRERRGILDAEDPFHVTELLGR